MLGWMNDQALRLTIETGEAHYFSRTRQAVWHKGATSGLTQAVVGMRIDDDQDAVWLGVAVADNGTSRFTETKRRFDPVAVYGDALNPTIL